MCAASVQRGELHDADVEHMGRAARIAAGGTPLWRGSFSGRRSGAAASQVAALARQLLRSPLWRGSSSGRRSGAGRPSPAGSAFVLDEVATEVLLRRQNVVGAATQRQVRDARWTPSRMRVPMMKL